MSKPILLTLYISLASIIGFIGGVYFGASYKKDVVFETITEYKDVRALFDWYELIIHTKINLEGLEQIENMEDLETLKSKYKSNGMSHIGLFREQAEKIKGNAPNPEAIVELEESVNDMENVFL
jgi:hypothetical protein